jgi:hypothetical protein
VTNLIFQPLNYHTTTRIWLSLEPWTNAGLKQSDVIALIEGIRQSHSSFLRAESSGLNHNVIVECHCGDREYIEAVVDEIRYRLNVMLKNQKQVTQ